MVSVVLIIILSILSIASHVGGIRSHGTNAFMVETVQGSFVLPYSDSIIAGYLKNFGQWEYGFILLIKQILARQQTLIQSDGEDGDESYDYIIFDIGANLGTWSIPLSFLPHAKVYAFEPQRYMVQYLRANVLLNGVSNVFPVYCAVSNETGLVTVTDFSTTTANSSTSEGDVNFGSLSLLGRLTNPYFRREHPRSLVPTITLDAFRQHTLRGACPRFLKLDIEMYEVYAFIGARQLLRECRPVVFMESHCTALNKPMFLLLHSMGYQLYWVVHPLLDTDILDRMGTTLNFDEMLTWSDWVFNQLYFGNLNVLALPKLYTCPHSGRTVSGHDIAEPYLSQSLFSVAIGDGDVNVDVASANIRFCVRGFNSTQDPVERCGQFFQHERNDSSSNWNHVDRECGPETEVNDFLLDYWKHYEFAMRK